MRPIILFALISLMALSSFAQDTTAQQILDKYLINSGGQELWDRLESIQFNGNLSLGEETYPIRITQVMPNLQRVEMEIRGKTVIQAFDGQRAWMLNPLNGNESPSFLPEDQLIEWESNSLVNNLIQSEEKGITPELVGEVTIEDDDLYMISLTNESGIIEFYFIDQLFYRPVLNRKIIPDGPARGQRLETYMKDYRETYGYMLPYSLETRINGQLVQQISWESIEVEPEVDTRIFVYPPLLAE